MAGINLWNGTGRRRAGREKPDSLRLLFVLPHLLTDGPSRHWSILIPALVEQGHDAAVLTLDAEGQFFDELRARGVPTRCAAMRRPTDIRRLGRAIRAVSFRLPDVVVTHGPGPQLYGQILAWRWGAAHVTVERRAPELPLKPYQEAIGRMVAPHTQRVIAVSAKQLPRLRRRGYQPERIRVIPNAVAAGPTPTRPRARVRSALGFGPGDFVALLIAMLRPEKRADLFVRAVFLAHGVDARIRGVVAGSGPELDRIRQLVAGREGVLRVLGHRTDIPDLIRASDVVCQSSAAEGLPTALLEGMAQGRPIVASAVGGTDEVVIPGETGFLVPPYDEQGLAERLLALAADPALGHVLGEAGQTRQREHFSEDRMRAQYALVLGEARAEFERTRGRPVPDRFARAVSRFMVRTGRGPLRPLWAALYTVVARAVAAYLRRGHEGASAYVCRSLAVGEPVYGLSDIDLVVVIPGDPDHPEREHKRVKRRWQRLCRVLPPLGRLLPDVAFYEDAELREATAGSTFTFGLECPGARGAGGRAAFFGAVAPADDFGLRSRPGLFGPMHDWRLVAGPDRRPGVEAPDRQDRRIASWLELQFWWSFAFKVAADPTPPYSAFLCVKLIAEPARIWLSLVADEQISSRRRVLARATDWLPDEEEAFRQALELHDSLARCPRPPLAATLPAFVRLSSRIARQLGKEVHDEGVTEVRLIGGTATELTLPTGDHSGLPAGPSWGSPLLPLVDWRALAVPSLADEAFALLPGSGADPAALGPAARAGRSGPYPALRADELLILPALGMWERAFLRAVQCRPTDPVSFALADGRHVARFPNVRGWCAEHWARRAVAEHRAWLDGGEEPELMRREWLDGQADAAAPSLRALAKLFTAARAGLFLQSIESRDPELRLTVAAVAERLAEEGPGASAVAKSALEGYRTGLDNGSVPATGTVRALRELVAALPAYAPVR